MRISPHASSRPSRTLSRVSFSLFARVNPLELYRLRILSLLRFALFCPKSFRLYRLRTLGQKRGRGYPPRFFILRISNRLQFYDSKSTYSQESMGDSWWHGPFLLSTAFHVQPFNVQPSTCFLIATRHRSLATVRRTRIPPLSLRKVWTLRPEMRYLLSQATGHASTRAIRLLDFLILRLRKEATKWNRYL